MLTFSRLLSNREIAKKIFGQIIAKVCRLKIKEQLKRV